MGLFSTNKETKDIEFQCGNCNHSYVDNYCKKIRYEVYGNKIRILYISTCPECGQKVRIEFEQK